MADLYRTSGDPASMITLGPRLRMLPATPNMVVGAFCGRGLVTIVPEVFRSGHRGRSSYLIATDGSGLQAWIPAFGPAPWATSPEGLAAELLEHGISNAISSGAPPAHIAEAHGPYDGREIQPYAARPRATAPPAAPASRPAASSSQMELFA